MNTILVAGLMLFAAGLVAVAIAALIRAAGPTPTDDELGGAEGERDGDRYWRGEGWP